jgi:hypothetical protein
VTLPICVPVTSPIDESGGRLSRSQTHSRTTCSTIEADGPPTYRPVLVPRAGQPVRSERGRQPAADDEAEIAPARHRDEAGIGGRGQFLDHLRRLERLVLQRHAQ